MTEWQLVPKEPTEEMVQSCNAKFVPSIALPIFVAAFKTMADAAPKPEPTVWYNTRNGDTESMYNSMMGDNWIPLYALKETS